MCVGVGGFSGKCAEEGGGRDGGVEDKSTHMFQVTNNHQTRNQIYCYTVA